jgi:Mg2+-importing ATPase
MVIFGLISSAFDFITFGVLIFIVKAAPEEFRTGWFVESLMTELLITLVLRTRRSIFKSKPSFYLWFSTLAVTVVALVIPYLPFGPLLGFTPLPPLALFLLLMITAVYVVVSEVAKLLYYQRLKPASG